MGPEFSQLFPEEAGLACGLAWAVQFLAVWSTLTSPFDPSLSSLNVRFRSTLLAPVGVSFIENAATSLQEESWENERVHWEGRSFFFSLNCFY